MNTIAITAKKDFLQQISSAPGLRALSELIWNGFDAGADTVEVELRTNALGGLDEVQVIDNGGGIFRGHVENLFGNLGESWKRKHPKLHGRYLHGRNGRGRFKGFSIGELVEWRSCYELEGQAMHYTISGSADSLEALAFTDPIPSAQTRTGTTVIISNIKGTFGSLLSKNAPKEIAKIFGVYLSQYPSLTLLYNGTKVEPAMVQLDTESRMLEEVSLPNDRSTPVSIEINEWTMPTKRSIQLCDAAGNLLEEVEVGPAVRAPGYAFTVKACSDHFLALEADNQLAMGELQPDVSNVVTQVRTEVKNHFRARIAARKVARVSQWIEEGSHPFPDLPEDAPQRSAFEKLATHLDNTGADIQKMTPEARMLNFHLLGTVLVHHPDTIATIVDELFPMKKADRRELINLLEAEAV